MTMIEVYRIGINATPGTVLAAGIIGMGLFHRVDAARRWLVAWLLADAIASLVAVHLRITVGNTQYAAQVWYPISAALALMVVGATLSTPRSRHWLSLAAAAVVASIICLTLTVEVFGDFSRYTGMIHGLTLSMVGSFLIIQRAVRARGDMLTDPTFLIGVAFLLIGTPSGFLALSSRQLKDKDLNWRLAIYTGKNAMAIVSYLLMVVALYPPGSRRMAAATRAAT